MSDYTELKSLFKRWGLPMVEYTEGECKSIEPCNWAAPVKEISGSCLGSAEFIFNKDESFKTLKIEGP